MTAESRFPRCLDVAMKHFFMDVVGRIHLTSAEVLTLRRSNRDTAAGGKGDERKHEPDRAHRWKGTNRQVFHGATLPETPFAGNLSSVRTSPPRAAARTFIPAVSTGFFRNLTA